MSPVPNGFRSRTVAPVASNTFTSVVGPAPVPTASADVAPAFASPASGSAATDTTPPVYPEPNAWKLPSAPPIVDPVPGSYTRTQPPEPPTTSAPVRSGTPCRRG